ncbi:MAG: SRPBCC family protein [Caulobacteraceae bacterium]
MAESRFLYVTYIRAAPERVWEALTNPETNRLFWGGYHQESAWRGGAAYRIVGPDGAVWDEGEVLVADPPRRLCVSWRHLKDEAMKAEGASTATFDLEPQPNGTTRLTLTHAIGIEGSKLIDAVSGGWPMILSSLKSLLETGEALG